jgi:hypothetical protein
MPPRKKSEKNTPTEPDQEDHHVEQDNGNSLAAEPYRSQTRKEEQN